MLETNAGWESLAVFTRQRGPDRFGVSQWHLGAARGAAGQELWPWTKGWWVGGGPGLGASRLEATLQWVPAGWRWPCTRHWWVGGDSALGTSRLEVTLQQMAVGWRWPCTRHQRVIRDPALEVGGDPHQWVGGDSAPGSGSSGATWAACGEVMGTAGQGPRPGESTTSAKGPFVTCYRKWRYSAWQRPIKLAIQDLCSW